MKIPKKIKVGPMTYKVEITELKTPDGRPANGHTSFSKLLIRIADDMPKKKQELSFVHELIHAMMEHAGLNARYDTKEKEEITHALTGVLYQVLEENKLND